MFPRLLLVLLLLASPSVFAQGSDPEEASVEERAQVLYKKGDDHYAAGRYEQSIRYFKSAYKLSPKPLLIFNVANAYERLGESQKAVRYLKLYLKKSPEAGDAAAIRDRIRALEGGTDSMAGEGAATPTPAPVAEPIVEPVEPAPAEVPTERADALPAETPAGAPAEPEAARKTPKRSSVGAYSTLGFGLASLGASAYTASVARTANSDAAALCQGALCPGSAATLVDREKQFGMIADISLGVGVVAMGLGTYFLLRNRRAPAKPPVTVGISASENHVLVGVTGEF